MRLDGRKDIQSVNSACSVSIQSLKTLVWPTLNGNNKGKTKQTDKNIEIAVKHNEVVAVAEIITSVVDDFGNIVTYKMQNKTCKINAIWLPKDSKILAILHSCSALWQRTTTKFDIHDRKKRNSLIENKVII